MKQLFTPFRLRETTFRNRIFVSPMCQYSCEDGLANAWHMVHLGSRAVGGAALVMTEATAVTPEARISPQDLGIWSSEHARALAPIAQFIRAQGAVAGIQLAHAGRKASTFRPWDGSGAIDREHGGWEVIAPSALPFNPTYPMPRAMTVDEIEQLPQQFVAAAERALEAGFEVAEVHAAHGYLLHQFLSPLSNQREDRFGGSFDNRVRAPLAVIAAIRKAWPDSHPLFVRISASDWVDGGWDLAQSVRLARMLKELGVDLVDCSSGGLSPLQQIPVKPGYQVPFAEAVRREAGIPTGAVGLITDPVQAEDILAEGKADALFLARAFLRDPYWTRHAAITLGEKSFWPVQYGRA
jgi:2,4-dienoyl-CoA reductase-like NADH-dependent reductase (Old Yellow Enzyme family)